MPADTDIAILEQRLARRRLELTDAKEAERALKEACDSLHGEWLESPAHILRNRHDYFRSFVGKWLEACETLNDARQSLIYCETALAAAKREAVRS